MAQQHDTLLLELGLSAEEVKAINDIDPTKIADFKADEYSTKVAGAFKTKLSNDPDFLNSIPEDKIPATILKKIESGQYARYQNELEEVAIKKLGLDANDLTAEDKKSIKGFVEKIATTYLTKKGNVQGLQDMQKQLADAQKQLEDNETAHNTKLTAELEKANGMNTAKIIRLQTAFELIGLDKIALSVPASYITEPVLAKLNNLYTVVLNADDTLAIKQKANPALDVMEGSKVLTFKDVLRKIVIADKLGVETTEDDGGGTRKRKVVVGAGGDGGGGGGEENDLIPSYIKDKVDANAALNKTE